MLGTTEINLRALETCTICRFNIWVIGQYSKFLQVSVEDRLKTQSCRNFDFLRSNHSACRCFGSRYKYYSKQHNHLLHLSNPASPRFITQVNQTSVESETIQNNLALQFASAVSSHQVAQQSSEVLL